MSESDLQKLLARFERSRMDIDTPEKFDFLDLVESRPVL
jgi:hypothetical protein